MKIEVLGTGCTTCNTAEAVVRQAVERSSLEIDVVKWNRCWSGSKRPVRVR